jgi:hypothetical protein
MRGAGVRFVSNAAIDRFAAQNAHWSTGKLSQS